MKKMVLFAFNGEAMCFIHVLLNALSMKMAGHDVKVVIEGAATKLIPELVEDGNPLAVLYRNAREKGLIEGACKACANKMGTLQAAEEQGLRLLDDMSGHPGMARYIGAGYEVITF
ncbi:MAG: DsrE family protein [Syntrophorhabdaceae bacterium]|nr:DsrE family protein [Syntrophorhabdaceae bacterium]